MARKISRKEFLKAFIGGGIITGGAALSLGGYDALQADPPLRTSDISRLGLGGGGVNRLSLLQDVNIPSPPPLDSDVLTFKGSLGKWTNQPAPSSEDHKFLIDSADTTADFLSPKLLVGSGITKTVENPAAKEDVKLAFDAAFGDARYAPAAHNLLSATHPDTLPASPVLGDLAVGNATPQWARFPGDTSNVRKFLRTLSVGAVAQFPAWDTLAIGDISSVADPRYVLKAGDTMTGLLSINIPGAASDVFETRPTGTANPLYGVNQFGETGWGPGTTAFDIELMRASQGVLRIVSTRGQVFAGIEVQGSELGGGIRRFSENVGRAVIQDLTGAHLNDIERTRFTLSSPFTAVGAGAIVDDINFFVPTAKTLKIWWASWVATAAGVGVTFFEVFNATTGVTVFSQDTNASGTSGDPSTNTTVVTNASTGNIYQVRRRNTAAKTAFTYSGVLVMSIE